MGNGVVTSGGLRIEPGSKLMQLIGNRVRTLELVEQYAGATWIAKDEDGKRHLVYLGLR